MSLECLLLLKFNIAPEAKKKSLQAQISLSLAIEDNWGELEAKIKYIDKQNVYVKEKEEGKRTVYTIKYLSI